MAGKKWNNRGFTLVELIVSIGLLVVVIALTCSIILSVFNHYGKESQITEAKNIGDTVSQWLNDQLRYATELEITDDTKVNTYDTAIQTQKGNLFYWKTDQAESAQNLYGENFYFGTTVETKAKVKDDRWLTLTVVVYDSQGDVAYTKENTYEIINMGVAAKEGELDINGTVDENAIKVKVSGNLEEGKEWVDPVFCLNSNLVVSRSDYFPPPQDMYNYCVSALDFLRENPDINAQYNGLSGNKGHVNNEAVRGYVLDKNYNRNWPLAPQYVDLDSLWTDNPDPKISDNKQLPNVNISIQPHVAVGTGAIVIFGRNYGNGRPNDTGWYNYVLVFVPDRYSGGVVDMSSGKWYTYLPTPGHPRWEDNNNLNAVLTEEGNQTTSKDGLTDTNKNIEVFYNNVKKIWHPIDGIGCTCEKFHKTSE